MIRDLSSLDLFCIPDFEGVYEQLTTLCEYKAYTFPIMSILISPSNLSDNSITHLQQQQFTDKTFPSLQSLWVKLLYFDNLRLFLYLNRTLSRNQLRSVDSGAFHLPDLLELYVNESPSCGIGIVLFHAG